MTLAEVRAELEEELSWRMDEIRFFRNRLTEIRTDAERNRFRRAMVVMLYAHFEGFWRAAFMVYVKAVNSRRILCADAADSLVAAAFADVFDALSDMNRKSDFFRDTAPDDTKLHRYCRGAEFAGRVKKFGDQTVEIVPENVVDTESNLKPVVIRKILYRLGFDFDSFKQHEGTVNWLLNWRNSIAHGATRSGITQEQYEPLELAVLDVMRATIALIYGSLRERKYLKWKEMEYAI